MARDCKDYLLQVSDAADNNLVTSGDLSLIDANMGPTAPADDSRYDIDGNMFVTNGDLSIANAHMSGYVPKPCGHGGPCP